MKIEVVTKQAKMVEFHVGGIYRFKHGQDDDCYRLLLMDGDKYYMASLTEGDLARKTDEQTIQDEIADGTYTYIPNARLVIEE
jgi:hypothetical protein